MLAADKIRPAQSRYLIRSSRRLAGEIASQHRAIVTPEMSDGGIERRKEALVRGR